MSENADSANTKRLSPVQSLFMNYLADKGGTITPFATARGLRQDRCFFGPWKNTHELQRRTVKALEDRGLIVVLPGLGWGALNYMVRLTDKGRAYLAKED